MRLIPTVVAGLATALACMLFAAPAVAQCGGDPIPPGNSEVDQYQEAIPGNCGETELDRSSKGGGSVSPSTSADLEALGEDGSAVAGLVAASGPAVEDAGSGKGGNAGKGDGPRAGPAQSSDTGGSAVAAAFRALTGDSDGGLGLALPALLVAIPATVLGLIALRRRSRP